MQDMWFDSKCGKMKIYIWTGSKYIHFNIIYIVYIYIKFGFLVAGNDAELQPPCVEYGRISLNVLSDFLSVCHL